MTQFTSVIMLYHIDSNLTDMEFLYIDLFLITVFAFFFGLTKAYEGPLASRPPMKSLISLTPLLSIIFQLIAIVGCQVLFLHSLKPIYEAPCSVSRQVFAFLLVQQQPWFIEFDDQNPSYNNTEWADYYRNTTISDSEVKNLIINTYTTPKMRIS